MENGGAMVVPLYSVAPAVRGEIGNLKLSSCPLALTHPDRVPGIGQAFSLYRAATALGGAFAGRTEAWSQAAVSAVGVVDSALAAMRAAEIERLRDG